jgi:hypothetical protein
MKTFKTNQVLAFACLTLMASGCDLSSLKGWNMLSSAPNASSSSSNAAPNSASGNGTQPAVNSYLPSSPSFPGSGTSVPGKSGKGDKYGKSYDDGLGLGGKSSTKYAKQTSSGDDDWSYHPSYPSNPSGQTGPYDPSYPNDPSGHSGHPGSGLPVPGYPSEPPNLPTSPGHSTDPGYGPGYVQNPRSSNRVRTEEAGMALRHEGEPLSEPCGHSHMLCLGIKYVSYVDRRGDEVESELGAIRDVEFANQLWRECGIQFQLDQYQNIRPQEYQLSYRTRNYDELNQIRSTFAQPGELLVVATGAWDRSGSLGNSWANAWTNLPGERLYGVVLEQNVSDYPQILAHELGHYLSLDHSRDARSLMYPIVSRYSARLSRQECRSARWAARTYWREMMR